MKKIISLLSALAIFSSMAVTGFAAIPEGGTENIKTATSAQPKIQGWVDSVDGDNYAIMYFKLILDEELIPYSEGSGRGKININGINTITVNLNLNPNVFETADEVYTNLKVVNGEKVPYTTLTQYTFEPVYLLNPGTDIETGYLTSVPEKLFQVDALLKSEYNYDNIPADAVTFGETIMSIQAYNDSKTLTNFTKYGANTVSSVDYPLEVAFTGTSTEWPEEGGETVTPVAMDAGVEIAEGPHAGKTSVSAPEAVAVKDFTKITVTNDKDTSKTLEWTAPTTLGNGGSKVLPVLVFDKVATANSKFTITLWNVTTAVKIFEHAVTE